MYFSIGWYYFSIWIYCYHMSNAAPVGNKISEAFETHDKICSMEYAANERSYRKMFESLSGLTIPASLKEYDKKSYTGFKILRTYNIQLFNLGTRRAMDFVFCRDGKIQWIFKQPLEDEVDWAKPLCVYVPDASRNSIITADTKNVSSSKQRALGDLRNFHCFKLARKKKYTNRQVSLFFPGGWVGGLFYCDLDDAMKKRALGDMQENLQFITNKGKSLCTRENSIPLAPIQSDNYGKNWVEYSSSGTHKFPIKTFKTQMTKYVPYINTPNDVSSRLNFEKNGNISTASFSGSNWHIPIREQVLDVFRKNKMFTRGGEPWFSEIEVDENYHITADDISRWNTWKEHAMNKFGKLTSKPSKSFISSTSIYANGNNNSSGLKGRLRGALKKVEFKIWNQLQLNDKIISILGDDPKRLQNLQTEWKNLQMNYEKFDYPYEQ